MKTIPIGDDRCPALGLGTWRLRGDACHEAVRDGLAQGYRHIDTAQSYGNEEAVGRAVADSDVPRADVWITTKVANDRHRDAERSLHESLERLDTGWIDLALVHWPLEHVAPIEVPLRGLLNARKDGRVRHIGVSNFTPEQLEHALAFAPIACIQVEYHPLLAQEALLALCRERGVMLTAYAPLARGHEDVFGAPAVRRAAMRHGKTPAQVVLRWLIQQDRVAAIPKAASAEHRAANLAIDDFELSELEMHDISDLNRDERLVDPSYAPAWAAR
ncbi:MAG: aldo/keto reductase [Deltaproteobacteria bacterium]|nr:aldo/keto reductase [Deltaproteobacteria bacterium]